MRKSLAVLSALFLILASGDSFARSSGGGSIRISSSGGGHERSVGSYSGGRGSSHKGGHYLNPRTKDHYTRHRGYWFGRVFRLRASAEYRGLVKAPDGDRALERAIEAFDIRPA